MKISIIVPIYNKIKYLQTILEQIKNQSFTDFECLLIDDGSTDGSEKICDEFAMLDDRFRVFHIPNGGVSNARNIGLDNASGEYITFIDADDEILPAYIENLYNCIYKSGADIVISGYEKFWDKNDNVIKVTHPYKNGFCKINDCLDDFAEVQKNTGLFGCCVSKIFKRILCQDIEFDTNLCLAEDFDFYLKLYNKIETIYFDDKCLYMYRQAAANSSVLIEDKHIDYVAQLTINLRYKDFLKNKGLYTKTNKIIVEEMLANYLYFSLFHCDNKQMNLRLLEIRKIQQINNIYTICGSTLQKLVLILMKYKLYVLAKFVILIYRKLKYIIKGN